MSHSGWREVPIAKRHDAKTEDVAKWYASFGAIALADAPLSLILPLSTIKDALAARAVQ